MFFIVSKIAWALLQPSTLLIFATLLGLILAHTAYARFGRCLATIAGGLLTLCALAPLCILLIRPLEDRFPAVRLADVGEPTGIIALGGALNAEMTRARGPIALSAAGARLTEALALAERFPRAQLVFTGGSASLFGGTSESQVAEQFVAELGLPSRRLTIESRGRNTFENALFTRALLQPKPGERWILVTSAFHMPRAVACFRKVGFDVSPYPVDYFTFGDSRDYWDYTLAPLAALATLDVAAKEWLGLLVYWVTGRTAEMLPDR